MPAYRLVSFDGVHRFELPDGRTVVVGRGVMSDLAVHDPTISRAYQEASRPLLKWGNLLATNPRMLLLFALLFIGQPVWYFVAELTFFNLVLALLLRREANVCRRLLA